MADAIVQTIKIEVDGAEEAAAEIKKVGEATEEVQQTAAKTAGGTQELGAGLDSITQKSGISRGEMRALGTVMRQLGAGEAAGLAMQFNRLLSTFGALGVAALAAAMAFGALMKSVKEAKEASESVDRLSKVLSDTPEQLRAMQSAFKAAGVSVADFEKGFESLGLKVVERSANMAEAAAQSSKKVIDTQLAAAKASQAVSPTPGMFDEQIKQLEILQKQKAAYLANAEAAKAYENSLEALVPLLERAAQGEKMVFDAGIKTESLTNAITQRFAEQNQSNLTFVSSSGKVVTVTAKVSEAFAALEQDLKAGAPSARKMVDELNAMFNAMDPATQAKFKAGFKGVIPDSLLNQITQTTERYQKLRKAADDAAKFDASPAGEALKAFDAAVQASIEMVEGWGRSAKITVAEVILDWKKIWTGALTGEVLPESAAQTIVSRLGSLGSAIKEAVTAFVTTSVPDAWQWIKDTFSSAVDWIGTKINEGKSLIREWVLTPVEGAFGWLKSEFGKAVDWVANKINELRGSGGSPSPSTPGNAAGGLLGGRGTGTSDSNLAWVSRGEYITPARAVAQPGVLAFLEALRRSGGNLRDVIDGMGRFALGGMVRAPMAIPAFAGGGGMSHVTIQFPGLPDITGLRASSEVVDQLRKAAALAQVRSGGRKPSRYS